MKKIVKILIFFVIYVNCDELECSKNLNQKKIFCYFLQPPDDNFTSHSILENLFTHNIEMPCTHVIYAFAGLDIDGNLVTIRERNEGKFSRSFQHVVDLKERQPCLKVLVAVGGYNEGSEKFSSVAETEKSREKFAENVLKFLIFYGFDGIDVHWMFPNMRGGIKEDKENFVKLIESLKRKLTKRQKLVVAAIGAKAHHILEAYSPMKELCKHLDYVLLMTYDYQDKDKTSIGAPLIQDVGKVTYKETIDENLKKILQEGCTPEKIILGISNYGRVFRLNRSTKNHLGAPASEFSVGNEVQHGVLDYNKICKILKDNQSIDGSTNVLAKWSQHRMHKSYSNYAFHGKSWISFDDHETVMFKSLYALARNLGGMMFYTLNADDYQGNCGIHYPLITSTSKIFSEYSSKCIKNNHENCISDMAREHKMNLQI